MEFLFIRQRLGRTIRRFKNIYNCNTIIWSSYCSRIFSCNKSNSYQGKGSG